MYNLNDVKTLCDDAFLAVSEKGIDVSGMPRSQLPAAIRTIELNDYTNINQSLSNILGETVTDVEVGLAKLAAIKEAERQAIIAKGTLVLQSEKFEAYANKIRAIQSYSDLTYSGIMPNFILAPEPTGSTIVYMRPGATGDGTSWDNAMSDFVAAHASLSGSKNVIYMEEGVYAVTGVITLKSNIKIYGGFKATDHSWSSRNGFTYRTILDAQLTPLTLSGNSTCVLGSLTIINARNTSSAPFYNVSNSKNLIAQDCTNSGNGGGFGSINNCNNLIAINCTSGNVGGGFYGANSSNNLVTMNCKASQGAGFYGLNGCNNLLALNNSGGSGCGLYLSNGCANAKIINCSSTGSGVATYGDNNCKNFLVLNCNSAGGSVVANPLNCQNYTVANCLTISYPVAFAGGATLSATNKIYNFICFNNKSTSGSLVGLYLTSANQYYKLYNCRADTAITFATNAATYADIQRFSLVQNDNSNTKFSNMGTYPVVGALHYENVIINSKYVAGDYGDWSIPADSVLAGAGYWEDGFSFGWDIDGKPRNAAHCSIGAYEPFWA